MPSLTWCTCSYFSPDLAACDVLAGYAFSAAAVFGAVFAPTPTRGGATLDAAAFDGGGDGGASSAAGAASASFAFSSSWSPADLIAGSGAAS